MSSSKKSILLIGPTGAGKSSLGNLLVLNANFTSTTTFPFETSDIAASITKKNSSKESQKYIVIDTLGFNDTEYVEDQSKNLLREDLTDAIAKRGHAGIDVILACFKMGRYTSAVDDGFNYIFDAILGPSALSRTCLVITHCDAKYVSPITAADAQREWIVQAKEQNPSFKLLCDKIQSRILFRREWSLSSLEDTIDQFQPTIGTYTIEQARQTQETYRKRVEEQKQAEATAAEAAHREAEEKARVETRHREEQARLETEKKRQETEHAAALARAAAEKNAQLRREREEAERRRREAQKRVHLRDAVVIGAAAAVAPPVAVVLGIKKIFRWQF